MSRTILLLSLFSCAIACGGAGGSVVRPTPEADKPVPADTVITLERTQCFGTCPSYKVTVYADGRLVYEGRKFVKVEGTVNGSATQEQLKRLVEEFERADYFSMRDSYSIGPDGCSGYMYDSPWANTSIRVGGRSKSIMHYHGCVMNKGTAVYPPQLYELENRIDEIIGSARWVKGEGDAQTR